MISIRKVEALPDEVFEEMTPESKEAFRYWRGTAGSIVKMSPEVWVAEDGGKVLAGVGALKLGFLAPHAEIWMATTSHLYWMHLPQLRELWEANAATRIAESYPNCTVYARAADMKARRFIEWFGGQPFKSEDEVIYYRMN